MSKMYCKKGCLIGPLSPSMRCEKAFKTRKKAARFYRELPLVCHPCNGDEFRFPNKIASFSKTLPHNKLGEVNLKAYHKYFEALKSGNPHEFEEIPLGGVVKLVDPQAAYAFEMIGPDSHQLTIPAPPALSSEASADEMVELYWRALTRDVPFTEYDTNPLTIAAAAELSALSDFRGPRINGQVTPQTLFRESIPGALVGPYISQFLLKNVPYVATAIVQQYRTTVPNDDHLTSYSAWLAVQNGSLPTTPNEFDPIPRYIRNGRDLGEYVHRDISVEDGLNAALILNSFGSDAWDPSNPYFNSKTQAGFATFGPPHLLDFVTKASRPALEAAWFQKWLVHHRLRPEEYGGLIQNVLTGNSHYLINSEVLDSFAVQEVYNKYGSYLLPQAFAEGCPAHPSYPQGHGTFIGAQVTMLKAFFNESFIIPDPVVASSDGLSLLPYEGPPLTVGGELNKLASNIVNGRNTAGVHYRSDGAYGLLLGEAVAIGILRDYRLTYNEEFEGFSLTTFDGTTIKI